MTIKINPFRPNSPVNPGMFVGRVEELRRLESSMLQTLADQPEHFIITGERGIGKTSLLMYIRHVAEGNISLFGKKLKFLVVETDIDKSTTQVGLIEKIKLNLNRQLGQGEPALKFLKDAWSFLKRVKIMDSCISDKEQNAENELIAEEFAYSLASIIKRICYTDKENVFNAKYDGILILIDEADNSANDLNIGTFFKLLLERIQKQGCNRILIGLAGLPDLRKVLVKSHPSSLRIFEGVELKRLSPDEVNRVINICLKSANEKNEKKTEISDKARELLVGHSEGYPHFIQQFGHSSFSVDTDGIINTKDVTDGSFGERGALELIGSRYYRNDFYNKIQKESYRQVLRIMADKLDGWVAKKEIKNKFKGKEATLNNAIKALRDRHIIISKEGVRGVYRLQHKGFALWIKLYADPDFLKDLLAKAQEEEESSNNGIE